MKSVVLDSASDRSIIRSSESKSRFPKNGSCSTFFQPGIVGISNYAVLKKESHDKLQKKDDGLGDAKSTNSSLISKVLSSAGNKMDRETTTLMESKMGYDFRDVKIHNNDVAAKSANAIHATAYTSGNNIVFDHGQYNPSTNVGRRLLAHELTHVVQQSKDHRGQYIQRQPAVTPRGTNPEDCMAGVCQSLTRPPASVASAQTMTDTWRTNMLNCVHNHAPSSNASHQQDIVQNEEREIQDEASSSRDYFSHTRATRSSFRDFIDNLRRTCERKKREIGIEFRYNIVLDNSGMVWGLHPSSDWDAIENAFASMPPEATWLSPRLLTFRREQVHRTQPSVAGETDIRAGTITIYDSGFGPAPYSRSRATGIPSTTQTLQHEVGHIIVDRIPPDEYNSFFNDILHWRSYAWAWITTTNSPHPAWQAERNALKAETGMDDQQLDTWLQTLVEGTRTNRRNRSYFRREHHLDAYDLNQVPTISAFEYAASNKDDYLSELYTFCISNPEFVHQNLPSEQIRWLKRVVFNFPTDPNEILRLYAISEPQQTAFLHRIMRVFTWQQVNAAFQHVMATGGGTLA